MTSPQLTDEQQAQIDEINRFIDALPWIPQEGPQEAAYFSDADVTLYGGSAGGGKTDLAIGLALTQHRECLFIRRQAKQLGAVLDRVAEIIDPQRKGWSGQEGRWNLPQWNNVRRQLTIGSTPNLGDETKYQGRPRDLLVIDECANMIHSQILFLMGWVRSTVPGQRCRTLLCSNPPTGPEGEWMIEMFAPWLDPTHPNPAKDGDLRWYAMIDGVDTPVDNGERFDYQGETIIPQSRTFIPARLDDNKYLKDTGYRAVLQALPEPLRSQMLHGDFLASRRDSELQVIPTAWVQAAMDRWSPRPFNARAITSCGVDPSRGGEDDTVVCYQEGSYYHELKVCPGHEMTTGGAVAQVVINDIGTSMCAVNVDAIGIGAAVVDALDMYIPGRVISVNVSERSDETDWAGVLSFANKRAEVWWRMRDMLNPENGQNVQLPNDTALKAELCSPTYDLTPQGIRVESKKDLKRRLGRSTDRADALLLSAERQQTMQIQGIIRPRLSARGAMSG